MHEAKKPMSSRFQIVFLVFITAIAAWGLINPLGIRAALNNNVWSLAFVNNKTGLSTSNSNADTPPSTHHHAGLLLAHQALAEEDTSLALTYLTPYLDAKDRLVLETYADVSFLQEDYASAILIWKSLGQWYTLEQASRVLTQEGDLDSLILAHQSAYELFPERYAIHLTRSMQSKANLYIEETQYEQAIEVYQELLSLFPGESSIYIDLARVYFLNDQPDMTRQTIDHGAVLESVNSTFFIAAAQIYEKIALPEMALEAYNQALLLDPESSAARQGIEALSDLDE